MWARLFEGHYSAHYDIYYQNMLREIIKVIIYFNQVQMFISFLGIFVLVK